MLGERSLRSRDFGLHRARLLAVSPQHFAGAATLSCSPGPPAGGPNCISVVGAADLATEPIGDDAGNLIAIALEHHHMGVAMNAEIGESQMLVWYAGLRQIFGRALIVGRAK
jgi:hypothetical protein